MKCKHLCLDATNTGMAMTDTSTLMWGDPPLCYGFLFFHLPSVLCSTREDVSCCLVCHTPTVVSIVFMPLHGTPPQMSAALHIKEWPALYYWATHCALMIVSSKKIFFFFFFCFYFFLELGNGVHVVQDGMANCLRVVKEIRRRFVFEAAFSKWEGKKTISHLVTVESFLKLRCFVIFLSTQPILPKCTQLELPV